MSVLLNKLLPLMEGKLQVVFGGADGESPLKFWDNIGPENIDRHSFDAYWGTALGSSNGTGTLYITRYSGGTSMLQPDEQQVSEWRHPDGSSFAAALQVVERRSVKCVRLDDWCLENRVRPDFINLNVQGCERDVLVGAERVFSGVLGLQLELAFKPYYIGQPDFGDMFAWLKAHGFDLFDIYMPNHIGRMASPVAAPNGTGQLFECHTLWLRRRQLGWTRSRLVKQAVIAELYGQTEKAHSLAVVAGV